MSNDGQVSYAFKFPAMMWEFADDSEKEEAREFIGMNPQLDETEPHLLFDSNFECGNLDMAFKVSDTEYDLFMRVDTNTKGIQQWFNFSVEYDSFFEGKTVKFNILNFTKKSSLFCKGMRIVTCRRSNNFRYVKGCENISYTKSRIVGKKIGTLERFYYQLSFTFTFKAPSDKVFFSYSFPYSFSDLTVFMKSMAKLKRD